MGNIQIRTCHITFHNTYTPALTLTQEAIGSSRSPLPPPTKPSLETHYFRSWIALSSPTLTSPTLPSSLQRLHIPVRMTSVAGPMPPLRCLKECITKSDSSDAATPISPSCPNCEIFILQQISRISRKEELGYVAQQRQLQDEQ